MRLGDYLEKNEKIIYPVVEIVTKIAACDCIETIAEELSGELANKISRLLIEYKTSLLDLEVENEDID